MYKIFEVTYSDGGWHSGGLPHFFYVAESEEDIVANSKKYQDFLDRKNNRGGDIWISEVTEVAGVSGLVYGSYFENYKDFNIEITIKKKD